MLKTRRALRGEIVIETIVENNRSRSYLLLGNHVASDLIEDEVDGVLCWGASASVSGSRTSACGLICFSHCTYNLVVVCFLVYYDKENYTSLLNDSN